MVSRRTRIAVGVMVACAIGSGLGLGSGTSGAAAGMTRADAVTGGAAWRWPLTPSRIVAPFQAPPGPYAAGHRGIDLEATPGQSIATPAGGVLTVAQVVVDRPVVTVAVGADVLISMEPVVAAVPIGTAVTAGQPIGTVSAGGHCEDRCVHLGVRVNGEYVSPLLFLGQVPPAVLLPLQ